MASPSNGGGGNSRKGSRRTSKEAQSPSLGGAESLTLPVERRRRPSDLSIDQDSIDGRSPSHIVKGWENSPSSRGGGKGGSNPHRNSGGPLGLPSPARSAGGTPVGNSASYGQWSPSSASGMRPPARNSWEAHSPTGSTGTGEAMSYRDQLRASGQQALNRAKQSELASQASHDVLAPRSPQNTVNTVTPTGSPAKSGGPPIPNGIPEGSMRTGSRPVVVIPGDAFCEGNGPEGYTMPHTAPVEQFTTAPYPCTDEYCWTVPPGCGASQAPQPGTQAMSPAAASAGSPQNMHVQGLMSPQLMGILMPRAVGCQMNGQQIAAQLQAAAPMQYDD